MMIKKLLPAMVLAVMLALGAGAGTAAATYWIPTDNNVNYPNFSYSFYQTHTIDGSELLYLFDDATPVAGFGTGTGIEVLNGSTTGSVKVAFTASGGSWTATVDGTGNSLSLGDSPVFHLGFFDGSSTWMTDTGYSGDNSSYVISFGADYVTQVDADPVPVPGAVWMLASGLLGFFFIRRRR